MHDQKQKKHGLTFYCRRSVCVQLNKFYIFTLNLDVTKFVICKRKKKEIQCYVRPTHQKSHHIGFLIYLIFKLCQVPLTGHSNAKHAILSIYLPLALNIHGDYESFGLPFVDFLLFARTSPDTFISWWRLYINSCYSGGQTWYRLDKSITPSHHV